MLPTVAQEPTSDKPYIPGPVISRPIWGKTLVVFALSVVLLTGVAVKICVSANTPIAVTASIVRPALPSAVSYSTYSSRLAGQVHGIQWRANLTFSQEDPRTQEIPKKLYVSVADKTNQSAAANESIRACAMLNSGYKIEVMGHAERMHIMQQHAPLLLPVFGKLKPTEQNDFWSYLMLYLFGGWYFDHDVECLKPLEEMQAVFHHKARAVVGVEVVLPEGNRGAFGFCCPVQYCHWLMGSAPGHPIFGHVVDLMLDRQAIAEADPDSAAANQIDNPILTTGPGILTKAVEHYMALFDAYPVDIALEHPEMVGDLGVMPRTAVSVGSYGTSSADESQIFVKHMFAGTWKHGNSIW